MTLRAISYAVLQDYHQQKRHHSQIPAPDLSECDLRGFDLRDLDLSAANLSKADLAGALLGNTNLRNATLHQTRFANISLGALLAAGIEPIALLQQHRGATYYLLRLFHFSPLPEHTHTFALTTEECERICQVHANLPWQELNDQAVISALYPGRVWEDWLLDTTIRPILDWVMAHPESLPALRTIITARRYSYIAIRLRKAHQSQEQDVERLLATIQGVVISWERDEQQNRQRGEEEAAWLATPLTYPPAPWNDGLQVTQIKSRPELVTVLKAGTYYELSNYEIVSFEYGCRHGTYFLYHVEEPGSRGSVAAILQDGSVWWITNHYLTREPEISEPRVKELPDGSFDEVTDQEQDLTPLAAWLQSWGSPQTDLSPLGRACYLLTRAGIAKLIYQVYWYDDENQIDVQSCLDEQGNELAPDNPAISRAHWILYYEKSWSKEYYGRFELSVPEKRLVRLGDAQIPELEEDDEFFEGAEE